MEGLPMMAATFVPLSMLAVAEQASTGATFPGSRASARRGPPEQLEVTRGYKQGRSRDEV